MTKTTYKVVCYHTNTDGSLAEAGEESGPFESLREAMVEQECKQIEAENTNYIWRVVSSNPADMIEDDQGGTLLGAEMLDTDVLLEVVCERLVDVYGWTDDMCDYHYGMISGICDQCERHRPVDGEELCAECLAAKAADGE